MTLRMIVLLMSVVALSHGQSTTRIEPVERENTIAVYAGMGVHQVAVPDLVEYVNTVALSSQRVNDFGIGIGFFGGVQIPVSADWGVAIDHTYLFRSASFTANLGGTYDVLYSVQAPTLIVQRIVSGKGYFLKAGAGVGYRSALVTQKVSTFGITTEYRASGVGFEVQGDGQTAFGTDLFGYIGLTAGWSTLGTLKDGNGTALSAGGTSSPVRGGYYHGGLRFGLIQYF